MKVEKTNESIKIDDEFSYDLVIYKNEYLDDGFYNLEISCLDETTGMPIKKEGLVELHAWLTDQLGLGWVSVEDRLPVNDGKLPIEYCEYFSNELAYCSFWCEFVFDETDQETYFGECMFFFDEKTWDNSDGSEVIVKKWMPLPQPPEVSHD